MVNRSELTASIYEAGAMPELWPNTLQSVASSCGAIGSVMICAEHGFDRSTASLAMQDPVEEFAASEFANNNPRIGRLMEYLPHPGFATDAMLHTPEELEYAPIFRDYFRPRGLAAGAATAIYGASGDGIILTMEGFGSHNDANSSLPFLNDLRPHLARSAMLSWQLSLKQAEAAVEALAMVGSPAAMLGFNGQIIAANSLFEPHIGPLFLDMKARIRAADSKADPHLADAVENLLINKSGHSMAMPDMRSGAQMVMHFIPIAGKARDVFQSAAGLVVLAKVESSSLPDASLLEALFDLTPREAMLGREIAAAKAVKTIAQENNIAVETIRWHLKNLMHKTGQAKQSDLAHLIKSQTPPDSSNLES